MTQKLGALKGLCARLSEVDGYLQNVLSGRLPVNHRIVYELQDIFNLLPNLDVDELVKAFAVKTNDMMLAIYLASIIRSIVALHNLVDNRLLNKEKERKREEEAKKKEEDKKEDKDGKDGKGESKEGKEGKGRSEPRGGGARARPAPDRRGPAPRGRRALPGGERGAGTIVHSYRRRGTCPRGLHELRRYPETRLYLVKTQSTFFRAVRPRPAHDRPTPPPGPACPPRSAPRGPAGTQRGRSRPGPRFEYTRRTAAHHIYGTHVRSSALHQQGPTDHTTRTPRHTGRRS